MAEVEIEERIEILFAVEGHRRPFKEPVHRTITVAEFGVIAARAGGIEGEIEVFIENGEEPLGLDLVLIEHFSERFAPLHVAKPGKITTTVHFNNRHVERAFRPSATVEKVIIWAIGPDGLNLEGAPSDFQMKHEGQVLDPDEHLGKVSHGAKHLSLDLVFKLKPQGE